MSVRKKMEGETHLIQDAQANSARRVDVGMVEVWWKLALRGVNRRIILFRCWDGGNLHCKKQMGVIITVIMIIMLHRCWKKLGGNLHCKKQTGVASQLWHGKEGKRW